MAGIKDKFKVRGDVELTLRNADGEVKSKRSIKNLVVNTGLNFLAAAVVNASPTPMNAIAVGTGATSPAPGNTTLEAELFRQALTSESAVLNVATLNVLIGAGDGTGALTEAGIFNNTVAAGTMLSRVTFPVVNKQATDTLEINWTISFLNA